MSTREELTRQAEKALRQGRVDEAIAQYQELAHLEPVDWGLVKTLADLLERASQREGAARQFARWADHLFAEGFHSKAAALYKKVLKLEPADEHALWQLAEVSLELKLKADARVAFQRVADLRHRRGDAAGAAVARERLEAIEGAPGGPAAAPVRPPAYAPATPAAPVEPRPTPQPSPAPVVRPVRAGLWDEPNASSPAPAPESPPETPEARLIRLRVEAELADTSQAPDADARWHAVLEADPQDVAVRLRLIRAALDRGDLPTAERLGESLDASEDPSLTVLVELAFRRARPDALQRLVAGRVHAGAPPEHVLAPCAPLAARHPGAARAVLAVAVDAWTAAGQPGHAVLALEHGESLGILTTALHLQWVEICVDAGVPGLSRAQRGLARAYLDEQRFAEARAVAEDLFVRQGGEEPHRSLLLEILDRQGHGDPHRVLVDLLTPPSDTVDEVDDLFVVPAPAVPLAPPPAVAIPPADDYGYLPPLQVPADLSSAMPALDGFGDTGDSSIAVLDIDALLTPTAMAADDPDPPAARVGDQAGTGSSGLGESIAARPDAPAAPLRVESGPAEPSGPSMPAPPGPVRDEFGALRSPAPAPVVRRIEPLEPRRVAPLEPVARATTPAASAAPAAFDWAAFLGRDLDETAATVSSPTSPTVDAVALPVPPPPAPVAAPPVVSVEPRPPAPEPIEVQAPAAPPAGGGDTSCAQAVAELPGSDEAVPSPFGSLADVQPALDDEAPLQPSFAMPSAWLSGGPEATPELHRRTPEDDYRFAEELPARWERSRGASSSPPAASPAPLELPPSPVATDAIGGADVAAPAPSDASALDEAVVRDIVVAADEAGTDDEMWVEPVDEIEPAGALVEEEIDLTQLLEELRQFDTVLPDPVRRGGADDTPAVPSSPAPVLVPTVTPAPPRSVEVEAPASPPSLIDDVHHDDLLPDLSPPSPHEGATELDAVFDDLQRHADERGVAEQQLAAGRVFLAAGLASEAARAFERASLEPRSRFEATLALAELHKSRGQLQDAVSWYEQAAMAPVPDAAAKRPVLYDLAESLEVLGETDRALGVLLDLLSQVEDYRDARARLDRLLRVDAGG